MASTFVDKALHDCIERCLLAAQHRRYAYFTAELLLQCMLDDDDVKRAVRASGGKLTVLRRLLKSELADALTLAEDAPGDARPQASAGFVQTLERAAAHVASCGRKDKALHCLDVLVQMFAEEDGVAAHCMQRAGMTRLSLLEWIASLSDADGEGACPGCQGEEAGEEAQTPEQAIAPWAENLTELAREGKIDPLVGRADELKRIEEILCRKTKSNPLLVGEPGVGKTAIV
ncbi:MAG: ATP-dependent Clp protease ATP-binding subunit ClpA, partial [Duodenibacillus sp.]|nr:ATP-dependent Clp protease ATP-binding subunit ClpA [Duodenibacillus sp.]